MKLADAAVLERFHKEMETILTGNKDDEDSIDVRYAKFVAHIKDTAKDHFHPDQNARKKRKEWLTNEMLNVIEKSLFLFSPGKISRKIETAMEQHDPATVYVPIRGLRGGKQRVESMLIHDKNSMLLLNSMDRLERWKQYFQELLNVNRAVDQTLVDEIQPDHISAQEIRRQGEPSTFEEERQALKQMKCRKAPGNNNVTADMLKAGGTLVLNWLHEIFVDVWNSEEIFEEWTLAIRIRLFKKQR